ncbi:DNA polymerase III subunit delta [Candidatus Nitrosoglobus terrae]|uniref:DNA polymerase III subunit delta n=1 Tax=Candidatus Nitrosoglobus terrae TaxID=1630141 RepID=A0A1Q2SLB9_9GAMM|nr:DNA polymerase III subunit delta [Candidatus Nitrosoglobus terrae]BAW79902.1 DNA polymerase III subunit delta [Candidatus Nitrosoglobus terrae]
MKIKLGQLDTYLRRGLSPVYLLFGDELLLIEETAELIRAQASAQGFNEREVMYADKGFNWEQLQQAIEGFSLFSSRRLIELRISGGSLGESGAKILQDYAKNIRQDTLLLIIGNRFDRRLQESKWFSALEQAGVMISIPKLDYEVLPQWIENRMRTKGLRPTPEAILALARRLEGNLLACAQEIDNLVLLHPKGVIDINIIEEAIANNARYDAFRLVECALAGKIVQVLQVLRGLRSEGVEPTIILGALAWELRRLVRITSAHAQGLSLDQALREQRVWEQHKSLIKQALRRHCARHWLIFLRQLSEIDYMIKGVTLGYPWEELLQLCLMIAGAAVPLDRSKV